MLQAYSNYKGLMMGWFTQKESTRAMEIASLIESKEDLDSKLIDITNEKALLKERAVELTAKYEAVVKELAKLGIK
jgi:predicted nuclease with TOPRIM domain